MREKGQYQIQLMKTRSSSGVGQKIDLSFDIDTLKIFDNGENSSGYTSSSQSASSYLSKIKTSSTVQSNSAADDSVSEVKKITATVQSTKLSSLLNQIKSQQ
jgi:hypothetical protein